jgi:hypothetical protein
MSLLLVALAAVSASPTADTPVVNPNAGQPTNCPATSRYEASRRRGETLNPRKLTELPDADMYKAVYRRIGGCQAPIVVKYGIRG